MENDIPAPTDGIINKIYIKTGSNNIMLDPSRVGIGVDNPVSMLNITSNDNNVLIIS